MFTHIKRRMLSTRHRLDLEAVVCFCRSGFLGTVGRLAPKGAVVNKMM